MRAHMVMVAATCFDWGEKKQIRVATQKKKILFFRLFPLKSFANLVAIATLRSY